MTREEVALQAGTNSGYLDYLERSRDAALTPGAARHVASQTTPLSMVSPDPSSHAVLGARRNSAAEYWRAR